MEMRAALGRANKKISQIDKTKIPSVRYKFTPTRKVGSLPKHVSHSTSNKEKTKLPRSTLRCNINQ